MQGWVQGSQIRSLAKISDSEIVQGCITKSLTPHNEHGLPVRPADVMAQHIAELERELSRLDETAWALTGTERENLISGRMEPLEEKLQACKSYLQTIKNADWDQFELPKERGLEGCFTTGLINSRYPEAELDRYLPKPSKAPEGPKAPAIAAKPSRSIQAQECSAQCREIAKRIWDRQPDFTIAAMVNHSEIVRRARKPDGSPYSEMTIRNWIRDLCPNPKPGRRAAASRPDTSGP
jgi:hypothetical protein